MVIGMTEENREEVLKRLEEEGELAADYLEELLDIADFDGDIEIDVENDRASVAIVSEEDSSRLERLVGEDAEVLDALQELTRLAVQAQTGERSRLMLDVADYRVNRKSELRTITEEAITQVKVKNEPVELEAMNPFERKVCHDVIASTDLISESTGVEPNRRVVIFPAPDSEQADD